MKAEYTQEASSSSNVYNKCSDKSNLLLFLLANTANNNKNKFAFYEFEIEIEVSRINFITDKSIKAPTPTSASAASHQYNESPGQTKVSSSFSAGASGVTVGVVTAQIIWWAEQQRAVIVSISCDACRKSNGIKKLCTRRQQSASQQRQQQQSPKQQQHNNYQQQQHLHHHHRHNKLRYCVRSKSLALFLDYLREFVSGSGGYVKDHAHDQEQQKSTPSAAHRRLQLQSLPASASLLQSKTASRNTNVNACNGFEYKTKIYALYRHVQISGTSGQVQQQQQLKVAAIQLRFLKMLLAAAATAGAGAAANASNQIGSAAAVLPPSSTALPATALLQDHNHQLTINNCSQSPQPGERISSGTAKAKVKSIGTAVAAPAKVELMEAMKKLDADLVALFATAGEPKMEQLKKKQQQQLWPVPELADQELPTVEEEDQQQLLQEQELATPELFKKVNAVQLHLEALTLQPEGTKRMELLQNEVRPIFTVECQLSDDLIRSVPRTPMFHLMQFESEKFQSLTQCTRFGQTQQREVHLQEMAANQEMMMGSIYFTIWWREPGTCLNELLGMGRLPLAELYQASLLEQCKCIVIQRRDVHLASLYLKISLRADQQLMLCKALAESNNNNNNNSNDKNYHSAAAAGEYI